MTEIIIPWKLLWCVFWKVPVCSIMQNEYDSISNHQHLDYFLNRLLGCRSKKTSKLHITGLCEGNSPVTSEFPTQRASNAENVSIWWRLHANWTSMVGVYAWPVWTLWKFESPFDLFILRKGRKIQFLSPSSFQCTEVNDICNPALYLVTNVFSVTIQIL